MYTDLEVFYSFLFHCKQQFPSIKHPDVYIKAQLVMCSHTGTTSEKASVRNLQVPLPPTSQGRAVRHISWCSYQSFTFLRGKKKKKSIGKPEIVSVYNCTYCSCRLPAGALMRNMGKKNQLFYRRLDTKKQKKPQKKSVLVDVPADTCLDSLEAIPSFILNRGHLFF